MFELTQYNINPSPIVILGRGLRQGDPLSSFLLLIVVEGLNVILNASVDACLFSGYVVGVDSNFRVSHL